MFIHNDGFQSHLGRVIALNNNLFSIFVICVMQGMREVVSDSKVTNNNEIYLFLFYSTTLSYVRYIVSRS